ncbi:hypothetical protein BDN72DRAFT_323324 [Pluteus cervinus]|uniref:Uncharacterized protein n=1 Tax=Pluteus cervinus TaxID=181527 RepID=A0ACD3AD88_9AGAR|nr:hypothetical protein BDN72DRAFT_323324 [Pluteus cervinus]
MNHSASLPLRIDGLPKESVYQKIDSEISNLEERIRALRTLRNSLSPASSMPVELLSKVFLYSCDLHDGFGLLDNYSDEDHEEFEPDADCWMRLIVSWVSRHWRQVAHGHPQLWNFIHNDGGNFKLPPGYVYHCRQLSKGLGLCVDLYGETDQTIRASMLELDQVEFLSITLHPGGMSGPLRLNPLSGPEWKQPAPMLRELRLSQASLTDRDLFSGTFPQLMRINLYQIRLDWDIPLLSCPALRIVEISNPITRVTVPRIIHLLQSLPHLTYCRFRDCVDSAIVPVHQRVRHPNLQHLRILDRASSSSCLLLGLDIPDASISTWHAAHSPNCVKNALAKFQEDVGWRWSTIRDIKSFQSPKFCDFSLSTPQANTYHFLFQGRTTWSDLNFITTACQSLPLENLESCSTDCLSVEAVTLLGKLKHLRKLRLVKECAVRQFVVVLQSGDLEEFDKGATATSPTVLFPALWELALVTMTSPSAYSGLPDVLASRKANGLGLKKLTFSKSKVSTQDTAPFALVVDVVLADHW